jgi:flagellar export protein FliJ
MKGLDSLLRLHEWKLDEKRRKVSDLETLAHRLHDQLAALEKEMRAEQKVAASDVLAGASYGNYAGAVIRRREKLVTSLAGVEAEMSHALDEVAAAFREFKKYDMIRERNRVRAEHREKRLAQQELDEAGLGIFRRRQRV